MFLDSQSGPLPLPGDPSGYFAPYWHLRLQVHTLHFQYLVSLRNAAWSRLGSVWEDMSLIGACNGN